MAKIYNIEEGLDYLIKELICINCKHRFIEIGPVKEWLKDLKCPKCKEKGYLIDTGEIIAKNIYEQVCKENPKLKIYRKYEQMYKEGD